ncbi:unnamed protein product, partial [Meganyctiphanes norvegica]
VYMSRLWGHILLNVYVPSMLLLFISYLTLYFKPSIFQVRVLASLTILLVMCTLFSQVSSMLPKSSYVKLVDVWLLSCIIIVLLTIIFHTIIDRLQEEENKSLRNKLENMLRTAFKTVKQGKNGDKKIIPLQETMAESSRVTCNSAIKTPLTETKQTPLYHYVVLTSRATLLFTIIIFNIVYWSIALI